MKESRKVGTGGLHLRSFQVKLELCDHFELLVLEPSPKRDDQVIGLEGAFIFFVTIAELEDKAQATTLRRVTANHAKSASNFLSPSPNDCSSESGANGLLEINKTSVIARDRDAALMNSATRAASIGSMLEQAKWT